MPLGIVQNYETAESQLLWQVLAHARTRYPDNSAEYQVLTRAMEDARQEDAVQGAEEYSERELRMLYVLLGNEACCYALDSEEFHVATKAMADFRGQM